MMGAARTAVAWATEARSREAAKDLEGNGFAGLTCRLLAAKRPSNSLRLCGSVLSGDTEHSENDDE